MPSYTYTGPEISITLREVMFPQGEAIEVEDTELQKKLDNLPFFDSDKPKEVVKPVAVSNSEKDAEISRLEREVGRLNHEVKALRARIVELSTVEEATPVEVAPQDEVITEYTPGEPEPEPETEPETVSEVVEIPEDWREWHWKRRLVLAKNFSDDEIKNGDDADFIIEQELRSRGN